jgi:two-component system sensor histidine kinase KdpD
MGSARGVVERRGDLVAEQNGIFLPFQRHGDAPSGDGVDLGLAVARGLAEAMDGEVSAEETPGGGLTMVIELPNADTAGRQAEPSGRPRPTAPPTAEEATHG